MFPANNTKFIQNLCERRLGIGADGLILLENSSSSHFRMHFFNADGKEAEMCGNGLRCLVHFASRIGFSQTTFLIETKEHILKASIQGDFVTIHMPDPKDIHYDLHLSLSGKTITVHQINTGVPHVVLFSEDLNTLDIFSLGSAIRHHSAFAPGGTNVNFVKVELPHTLWIRTYERGVESETLACGTGATGAAIIACHKYGCKSPINVHTRSNEILQISFDQVFQKIQNLKMAGNANFIFNGFFVVN